MLSAELQPQGSIHVVVGDNSRIHSHLLAEALKSVIACALSGPPRVRVSSSTLPRARRPMLSSSAPTLTTTPWGAWLHCGSFTRLIPRYLLSSCSTPPSRRSCSTPSAPVHGESSATMGLSKCSASACGSSTRARVWASSREVKIALEALSSAPLIRTTHAGGLNLLSRRELQVVHCLAEGLTNRAIGARLGLSRHTIKNYLLKIFDKLGVCNRVELLFLALSRPAPVMQAPEEVEDDSKKDLMQPVRQTVRPRTRESSNIEQFSKFGVWIVIAECRDFA